MAQNIDVREVKYSHSWVVDRDMKIRRCEIGTKESDSEEKVIILLGETGVGKTTMVTRMINHLYGVQWASTHRYKLILDDDEKEMISTGKTSESQTQWISVYALYSGGSLQMKNDLLIIDTPGFLETGRKCDRDAEIVATMKALFSLKGYSAIIDIHALVLVLKSSTTRTGETFQGVIDTAMGIWGKDIASKINLFTTFADIKGAPHVINIAKEANVPFRKHYTFNNNALFTGNEGEATVDQVNNTFWQMGQTSLANFFQMMENATGTSVKMTATVLQEVEDLKNLLELISLKTVDRNKRSNKLVLDEEELAECREETKEYEDFMRVKEVQVTVKAKGKEGERAMVCNSCKRNCHIPCSHSDVDKCSAMLHTKDASGCSVCGCYGGKHEMSSFIYEYVTEQRTSVDAVKKSQHDLRLAKEQDVIKRVENSQEELKSIDDFITKCVDQVRSCLSSLQENALSPSTKTVAEYLREIKERQTSSRCSEFLESLINREIAIEMENPRYLARQLGSRHGSTMTSEEDGS